MRVLIVEDDPVHAGAAAKVLEQSGHQILILDDGEKAVRFLRSATVDLVVLDWQLPKMSGFEVLHWIRANLGSTPQVLFLTSKVLEVDVVLALEAGANDYVTKPFKFGILLARIRAHLRSHEASEDAIFQIGPYTFRPGAKLLIGERGSKLKLTEKETAILRFLYRAGREVVGRDTLLAEVWGYNAHVTTHTLETHIYRLRQKIEPNPATAAILVTEGGGYKLLP